MRDDLRVFFAPDQFVVVAPDVDPTPQIRKAVREAVRAGQDTVSVVIDSGTTWAIAPLLESGFHPGRQLLQLRCPLPINEPVTIVTRPFRPGTADELEWLKVNNRAFHWHPEQSGWTIDQLHDRMREPWFDPHGFFLHEIDGVLAGFCWTKVHPPTGDESRTFGEIFVIGVDPAYHGRGLGRALTTVGLMHLAGLGIELAMLYVEYDNAAAIRLYDQLGFAEHHRLVWYSHSPTTTTPPETSSPETSSPETSRPTPSEAGR